MTQRERVLRLLQDAGPYGVHTFELRGLFIANPSQRIADLEEEGHIIHHSRERLHGSAWGTRYVLEGAAAPLPVRVAEEPSRALFDSTSPPISPYREDAA